MSGVSRYFNRSCNYVFIRYIVSKVGFHFCFTRVQLYIENGWDKKFLKDPDGNIYEQKRKETLGNERRALEKILDGDIPSDSWTSSLAGIPIVTHSVVEKYFELTSDEKHVTEGYAFSKTKKFETSGRPMRINLLPNQNNMFVLEGYTRPAMKQAKGISSGEGLYACSIIFDKTSGKILAAKDHSCAAGKRGFCKHVAALTYKLMEATMSCSVELPKSISCTQIRQQWGIPSIKASQDPEKELMKRMPLQEIVFEKHLLQRDKSGGRKRKLPVEVSCGYTSRPNGEPAVDNERVIKPCDDLASSKCPKVVSEILKLNSVKEKENVSVVVDKSYVSISDSMQVCQNKENVTEVSLPVAQRSSEWFSKRIGKITSSKAPAVIGLQGKREFQETWDCIRNKKAEPSKNFRNFHRGIIFEDEAAKCFASESAAVVEKCGLYFLGSDQIYGASPDRTFLGETCKMPVDIKTGRQVTLSGLSLLEIKTRAEGNLEPLASVTGAHVAQIQLQEECTQASVCILQSYVPESKKSKYFLIRKNNSFINAFKVCCNAILSNSKIDNIPIDNIFAQKLQGLPNQVPSFENLLPLRQWANELARSCIEVIFPSSDG